MSSKEDVHQAALNARAAARVLRTLSTHDKNEALALIAQTLVSHSDQILAANALDVQAARATGTTEAMVDRLIITAQRLEAMAQGVRDTIALTDPVGEITREWTRADGLHIKQVRVPLGVIGMIYEARPNVTVDAATLCLKSGNAALLRGSSSAAKTNAVLVDVMRGALTASRVPVDAIQFISSDSRDSVEHLMQARGLVDLLIPRGGAELIKRVVEGSIVPVVETGVGNVHVYVDASADLDKALNIIINAKTQRVSVCNTAETLLVHRAIADAFMPRVLAALASSGVVVHGDEAVQQYAQRAGLSVEVATDVDWASEYMSLDLAVAVVDDLDAAINHIRRWTTGHTEAIVSKDQDAIDAFVAAMDSAAVMVNASTRFTDGGEFGFGAEIGISTQKTHARGPMGLSELTSTTYVVTGDGHIRD